ncbi:MAG TPA: alpha/beta fold hydrolase [Polyangiaceae bacterium]|jgi:homoserine O-acetyltransferase|nr:alpha/beta fold hydrolase [Polyangiaceae bacterium]
MNPGTDEQGAKVFALGDFRLQSGKVLADAKLVYQTYGSLAPDRSNVVLYPTSFGAQHSDTEWLVKAGGILDSSRWFVVIPNMFGNGLSTSPSHLPPGSEFNVSHYDNVAAQDRLLGEVFGVQRLALVYGWSMGAQQAYHWAVIHPERVERIATLCGTARTSEHNKLFLLSLQAALLADPAWDGNSFVATPERGFRAFARIYASWAASQAFYRDGLYRQLGYRDLDDYLTRAWEPSYRRRHPADLLAMLGTWMACDVSDNPVHQGDLHEALSSIRAKALVMPSTTDLYFPLEDCALDAAAIPDARLLPIPSIWGHRAGNPYQNPEDEAFIRAAIEDLMQQP